MAPTQVNGDSNYQLTNGSSSYSVPQETSKVFRESVLTDQRITKDLPNDVQEATARIKFVGSPDPSLPINWRFAEAVASLKGLEASLLSCLLHQKYGVELQDVTINTDHATLFVMTHEIWTIDPDGMNITALNLRAPPPQLHKYFPNGDIYRSHATIHRSLATNIYRCADGRYFNLHGDMNPDAALDAIGLPHEMDHASREDGIRLFQDAMDKVTSDELQRRCADVHRQSGSPCLSVEEFNKSEHGQANKQVGLWEIYDHPNPSQPAGWWPEISSTGVTRPLAGLKVVDLTRVIAAPAVTRGLAELGASVMRVTSPNLPDVTGLHPDLNWGKWNCSIDLKDPAGREKLKALVMDADVVVQGYRPGALDKYGFGQQGIIDMCNNRGRGIISARENCYGWHGPWSGRSGWQQISDAVCGCSYGFGRAMGHEEPVSVQPIVPHSDYCTGISGVCAILIALMRRGKTGGSHAVDLALNYYTTWLVNSVGEYPADVWDKLWAEHDRKVWHNTDSNTQSGPATVRKLREGPGGKRLFNPSFFEDRKAPGILGDKPFRHVKSVAQWPAGTVESGFRIGTRGNGVDAPHWPDDLSIEVVV